jgi:hypothetical protein
MPVTLTVRSTVRARHTRLLLSPRSCRTRFRRQRRESVRELITLPVDSQHIEVAHPTLCRTLSWGWVGLASLSPARHRLTVKKLGGHGRLRGQLSADLPCVRRHAPPPAACVPSCSCRARTAVWAGVVVVHVHRLGGAHGTHAPAGSARSRRALHRRPGVLGVQQWRVGRVGRQQHLWAEWRWVWVRVGVSPQRLLRGPAHECSPSQYTSDVGDFA